MKLPSYISLVKPIVGEKKKINHNKVSNKSSEGNVKTIIEKKENDEIKKSIFEKTELSILTPSCENERKYIKKIKKFKQNPKRFFIDSRYKSLNFLAKILF